VGCTVTKRFGYGGSFVVSGLVRIYVVRIWAVLCFPAILHSRPSILYGRLAALDRPNPLDLGRKIGRRLCSVVNHTERERERGLQCELKISLIEV
jgi:hypothetical protein